jgi:hypothetical protein
MHGHVTELLTNDLRSVGVTAEGITRAAALLAEPLPAALAPVDHSAEVGELARDVAAGKLDAAALRRRVAEIDSGRSTTLGQVYDAVLGDRDRAARRQLDEDATEIARQLDALIAAARKAFDKANEPLAVAGIRDGSAAMGRGSAVLAQWEQREAARNRLHRVVGVRRSGERAGLLSAAVPAAEQRSALRKVRDAVLGDVFVSAG